MPRCRRGSCARGCSRARPISAIWRKASASTPARLARDAASPEVTARIARSEALAARFGFFATPSLVVGRTAVTGALSERRLAALVTLESRLPSPC